MGSSSSSSRPETSDSADKVVRCSRCGGIDHIVINGVEQQLKGDIICACEDFELHVPEPQRDSELDTAGASPYPDDDQLASTSTPY